MSPDQTDGNLQTHTSIHLFLGHLGDLYDDRRSATFFGSWEYESGSDMANSRLIYASVYILDILTRSKHLKFTESIAGTAFVSFCQLSCSLSAWLLRLLSDSKLSSQVHTFQPVSLSACLQVVGWVQGSQQC
jgi:hypothetical protein